MILISISVFMLSLSPSAATTFHNARSDPSRAIAHDATDAIVAGMRVLILGGNGFIGSAAVAKLLACGHEVTALARGVQDLWFARLYILKPVVIGVLSLFWITSGLVALARFDAASGILAGPLPLTAALLTVATSLLDIALGAGVLLRRWSHISLSAMIVVRWFISPVLLF